MLTKIWDEITDPFPHFNGTTVILSHTLLGMWLFIQAGIKVKQF